MNADPDLRSPQRRLDAPDSPDGERPDWILDTRQMKRPRLSAVIDALDDVDSGETVVVITPISPVPLYDHLDECGWGYEIERRSPDEWQIRITVGEKAGDPGERPRRPRPKRLR